VTSGRRAAWRGERSNSCVLALCVALATLSYLINGSDTQTWARGGRQQRVAWYGGMGVDQNGRTARAARLPLLHHLPTVGKKAGGKPRPCFPGGIHSVDATPSGGRETHQLIGVVW